METLVILVVAAGMSAGVVWWAMSPPDGRPRVKEPRRRIAVPRLPQVPQVPSVPPVPAAPATLPEEPGGDGFVLLPADAQADDRPSPALSLLRLALTIAVVAAVGVAALALIAFLVTLELGQYFGTGS